MKFYYQGFMLQLLALYHWKFDKIEKYFRWYGSVCIIIFTLRQAISFKLGLQNEIWMLTVELSHINCYLLRLKKKCFCNGKLEGKKKQNKCRVPNSLQKIYIYVNELLSIAFMIFSWSYLSIIIRNARKFMRLIKISVYIPPIRTWCGFWISIILGWLNGHHIPYL